MEKILRNIIIALMAAIVIATILLKVIGGEVMLYITAGMIFLAIFACMGIANYISEDGAV